MSRKEIEGRDFDLAFGVDHLQGAFVQLWEKPLIDQDGVLVSMDSFGVHINEEAQLPEELVRFLYNTEKRFELFEERNPGIRPNLAEDDVINFAKFAGGFHDISREVYQIFGDTI